MTLPTAAADSGTEQMGCVVDVHAYGFRAYSFNCFPKFRDLAPMGTTGLYTLTFTWDDSADGWERLKGCLLSGHRTGGGGGGGGYGGGSGGSTGYAWHAENCAEGTSPLTVTLPAYSNDHRIRFTIGWPATGTGVVVAAAQQDVAWSLVHTA